MWRMGRLPTTPHLALGKLFLNPSLSTRHTNTHTHTLFLNEGQTIKVQQHSNKDKMHYYSDLVSLLHMQTKIKGQVSVS